MTKKTTKRAETEEKKATIGRSGVLGPGAAGRRPGVMAHHRYRPFEPVDWKKAGTVRRWPDRQLSAAPRWCSVDLRDGNQALVEPMGWDRKIRLFETLVACGFAEIEVGFPSASQTEFDFVRRLIEEDRVPDGVGLQVLTQCREDLIDRTFEAIDGAKDAIVHFYNSTSTLQRRVVFGLDRAGIQAIAVRGAEQVRRAADSTRLGRLRFQYSPESFTGTETDFAAEVCDAVMSAIEPSEAEPLILNLPATVEMSMPHCYADQVEQFISRLADPDRAIISVHPHNDRGCAVAAAELGLLAGATRVEGTLFGNGERTGNVDLVTLALNLMSQGIDPELDFRDLSNVVRAAESATRLPVHPRHPYAGELVFTAFSGSHQDAIRKGLAAAGEDSSDRWEVPYLPVDPADVGGTYDAVIRINSQSGKGGIAYLLESELGYELPRRMQIEFARIVQAEADQHGAEIEAAQLGTLFERVYLHQEESPQLVGERTIRSGRGPAGDGASRAGAPETDHVRAEIRWGADRFALVGEGAGPLDAFVRALSEVVGVPLRIGDYHEHALGEGAGVMAAAYVELVLDANRRVFGAGQAASLLEAAFEAVLSGVARAAARGWVSRPGSIANPRPILEPL